MALVVGLVLLLMSPSVAFAVDVPDEVVPGQSVLVTGDAGLLGGPVTLRSGTTKLAVGVVGIPFVWPLSYGERRFLPGERVPVDACSIPVAGSTPGILTSSQFCEGATTTIARVPGVRLRRVGRLTGAKWTGWGNATARGRVRGGGRATASRIVQCTGELWYSAVDLRAGGRLIRLRGLAPC